MHGHVSRRLLSVRLELCLLLPTEAANIRSWTCINSVDCLSAAAVCEQQNLCTCWTNATASQPPACYSLAIYKCPGGTVLQGGPDPTGQCSIPRSGTVSPSPVQPSPAPPSPAPMLTLSPSPC